VAAIALKGSIQQENVLKNLQQREKQRSLARRICTLQGKLCCGSTTVVTILDEQGQKQDLTNRKEIENAILQNSRKKFSQSFILLFIRSHLNWNSA
jgi:hypothetical protein